MSSSSNPIQDALLTETVSRQDLPAKLVDDLYTLYATHYDDSDPRRFNADLHEKDWVILLRDPLSQRVVGFSTQMEIQVIVGETPVRALFSGDTIIHPDYWGNQALVRAWCQLAGRVKARVKNEPLYWFLISKGYRTYLYLPLFFKAFYPSSKCPTPLFEQKLMWVLGDKKYSGLFNPLTGLVEHGESHDRLKLDLDKTSQRLKNPHVAFFVETNPRYQQGDELLCIAELSAENMRSIAKREFETGLTMNRMAAHV